MKYIRKVIYLIVVFAFCDAVAGSYEDFFAAIRRNDGVAVGALLTRGFDPNTRDPNGQPGLTLAISAQSIEATKVLLEHPQTDVEALNQAGESALMLAALKGELAWSQRLLDRGARLNATGWSALHYAATGPEPRVVALLLDRGALIDAESPNRSTPLMMAARYGSEANVALLLARGADPKRRNELELGATDFARLAGRNSLAAKLAELAR
jgi:ankyrin repeat protein